MLVPSQDMVVLPVHGELSVRRERAGEWTNERQGGGGWSQMEGGIERA